MTRPVTRGAQGGLKPPCKNCRPPWRNVLDVVWNYSTQSKNFGPSQKTLHHPWCPKLVTGLLMTSNTRSPGLVLSFEFKSTCLTAFDHPEKERLAACLLHDIDIAVVCFIWWNLLHLTENIRDSSTKIYNNLCTGFHDFVRYIGVCDKSLLFKVYNFDFVKSLAISCLFCSSAI